MVQEKRLGMGLDALLGGGDAAPFLNPAAAPAPQDLALEALRPNPFQPRAAFNDEETMSLADSIRKSGVLQPILVRRVNGHFEIVAGERRFRAAQMAGVGRVPVVVRDVTDHEMLNLALVENIQRKDLNPIEKARAFRQLMQVNGSTQEEVAESLGLARPTVANFLRLLELPPDIQEAVSRGTITMGHARALVGLTNRAQMIRLVQRIVNEDLSVRALEHIVTAESRSAKKVARSRKETWQEDLERRLTSRFGTKAEIRTRGSAGEIVIHYYSTEQLNGLLQQFGA